MASYEYNEEDLESVELGTPQALKSGQIFVGVHVGQWSMEYYNPATIEDEDSLISHVDRTILAWIAYRNWLFENPPEIVEDEDE